MANSPATTHVIEIETGIGEPAFIPLALGQELQPLSVGRKGMWKLESQRVLDVHAFVYFDGTALFLQSADEANAATVDGYKIGKAWTELHAPCSIELGSARLKFRSLSAANDEPETVMAKVPIGQGNRTQALMQPPVQMGPGGPGSPLGPGHGGPPPANPRDIPSMPPAAGRPPPGPGPGPGGTAPQAPPIPLSFPKENRPFKPGEFASRADDDSTRIAPLDQHLARSGLSPAAMAQAPAPFGSAPMMPQGPGGEEQSTRPEGVQIRPGGSAPQLPPSMSGPYPQLGMSGQNPMMMPGPSMPPMNPMGPMGPGGSMPPMPSGQYPGMMPSGQYPGMMPPGASGQYNAMNSGMNPALGGYGGPAPAPEIPKEVGLARLVAEYKSFSGPKKILVFLLPVAMLGGVFLLFDDEPQKPVQKRRADAGLEAGADGGMMMAAGEGGAPSAQCNLQPNATVWPAGVPCPPPGWQTGAPLPCIPAGCPPPGGGTAAATAPTAPGTVPGVMTAPMPTEPPPADAGAPTKERDAGAKEGRDGGKPTGDAQRTSSSNKTLERQAVDLVSANRFVEAAAIYDQLAAKATPGSPNEAAYREAARICRAKAAPGQ